MGPDVHRLRRDIAHMGSLGGMPNTPPGYCMIRTSIGTKGARMTSTAHTYAVSGMTCEHCKRAVLSEVFRGSRS
jgi:hypothetical protein